MYPTKGDKGAAVWWLRLRRNPLGHRREAVVDWFSEATRPPSPFLLLAGTDRSGIAWRSGQTRWQGREQERGVAPRVSESE